MWSNCICDETWHLNKMFHTELCGAESGHGRLYLTLSRYWLHNPLQCHPSFTVPHHYWRVFPVTTHPAYVAVYLLFDCFPVCGLAVFENKDKIVIVMEYASRGDLYDYISEKQRISEREARHFFRQIVSAVHYCHRVRHCISISLSWQSMRFGSEISLHLCTLVSYLPIEWSHI